MISQGYGKLHNLVMRFMRAIVGGAGSFLREQSLNVSVSLRSGFGISVQSLRPIF